MAAIAQGSMEDSGWTADHASAVQHSFRGSPVGEAAVNCLVIVVVLIGLVSNLPESEIKSRFMPLLGPVAGVTGLDQYWAMYAPNPPRRLEDMEVHVTMADGTDRVWTLPTYDPLFGVASQHRWRKIKESLVTEPSIRRDFAHWVVRQVARPQEHVERVYILLRTEDLSPPGVRASGDKGQEPLYDEILRGQP